MIIECSRCSTVLNLDHVELDDESTIRYFADPCETCMASAELKGDQLAARRREGCRGGQ